MRPTSGLTFGARYQLSSRVAIGGMGEVWQATDLVIGRTVAIKILKDEYLGDPGFLERFRAEARHAALVNHEGIANVFDYGEEEGSAYLVMELVPGEALSAIIERERVLDPDRVLDMVAQTAAALQAAHAAGLVHRDIKPGNLLITPEGRVKITDFGIARIADQVPLTATGQVMGTVQYLSPEQASGHPASPTTDIYSLGIVAYEALAGRRPFTGESQVAIAMAQINETPPELPMTVPEPVRNLVYACLAKSPGDRPASASHLSRAAQSLRRGDVAAAAAAVPGILGDNSHAATVGLNYGNATQATRVLNTADTTGVTSTETLDETKKRNPWTWPIVALISLLAVVLIGAIIALLLPTGDQTPPPTSGTQTSSSPTPPSTPTPTTVELTEAELLDRKQDAVEAILNDKGLVLDAQIGSAAESSERVGFSYRAAPVGNVQNGATITVFFYDAVAVTPTPTQPSANTLDPLGPYAAAAVVTVKWANYEGCPPGHPRSGFNFLVQGATINDGNPTRGPNETQFQITLPANSGDETKISYTALCTDLESPPSSEVIFSVQ